MGEEPIMMREPLDEEQIEQLEELDEKDIEDMSRKEKNEHVNMALRKKYAPGEWATFFEFQVKQGGRRADFVALNTWPSRNFKIVVCEVKVDRSDWLREKKESAKNDLFVGQADEFYIAATKDVVNKEELPEGWGLMELRADGLMQKKVESDLTEAQDQPMKKSFFAKLVAKSFDDSLPKQRIIEARRRGYNEGKDRANNSTDYKIQRLRSKAENWDKLKDSPLKIYDADDETLEEIEQAKKLISKMEGEGYNGVNKTLEKIKSYSQDLEDTADEIEKLRNNLKAKVT